MQQQLADKGIRFPAGATATFLPGSSKLVVRDTPEQLDLIANLIDQLSKETPQVQIEAKIAEFTQDAIKGLSFNYAIGTGTWAHRSPASAQTPRPAHRRHIPLIHNGGLDRQWHRLTLIQNNPGSTVSREPRPLPVGPSGQQHP